MGRVIVAPSILAADFSRLGDEIHRVEAAGADWIHCDIMDGHFVDNISFGPEIVGRVRGLTSLPLDVHLMIEHADHYVPRFIKAGANSITVHAEPEAKHSVTKTLRQIRDAGCRAGLTLNPETSFDLIAPFMDKLDHGPRGTGGETQRDENIAPDSRRRLPRRPHSKSRNLVRFGGALPGQNRHATGNDSASGFRRPTLSS